MKGLETGKDRVKKICDALRKETLEPAILEAASIVDTARQEADRILHEAKRLAETISAEAKEEIAKQKSIFQASLQQAWRQTIELLKQHIEEKLFDPELKHQLGSALREPKVLATLTSAIIHAIEKEGLVTDLSVAIPAAIPARAVNELLAAKIVEKLREKSVILAPIGGGIEVKLHKDNITLDLSDTAVGEIISGYIRKDFRDLIFKS